MLAGYDGRKCAFCDPLDREKNNVLFENGNWRIWKNPFPLGKSLLHMVMATTHHLPNTPIHLDTPDFRDMGALFVWAQQQYPDIFGNSKDHWEAHIIVPDLTGSVQFKLGPQDLAPSDHPTRVLAGFDGTLWNEVVNAQPMSHTSLHLIFGYKGGQAITLTRADFGDMGDLFLQTVQKHNIPGGGFIVTNRARTKAFDMRFGSVKYNEGSVLHQHANIIVSDPAQPALDITLGKDQKKGIEGMKRMLVFEKIRTGTSMDSLSQDEQDLVKDRLK